MGQQNNIIISQIKTIILAFILPVKTLLIIWLLNIQLFWEILGGSQAKLRYFYINIFDKYSCHTWFQDHPGDLFLYLGSKGFF